MDRSKVAITSSYDYSDLQEEVNELISHNSARNYKLVNSTFTTTYDQKTDTVLYTAYLVFA